MLSNFRKTREDSIVKKNIESNAYVYLNPVNLEWADILKTAFKITKFTLYMDHCRLGIVKSNEKNLCRR